MNISFIQKQHRLLFYTCWLVLGLMQAGLTELLDDEAYYWVYGQYLDWGYYDHPPMIGLLIKMGYAIFPNELGVRLYPLLLNILSLVIIEKLIDKKNPFLFYTIALSIAVLQLIGFVAVPDIPLIFFTAVYFLFYKKFCEAASIKNTLLLGLAIAFLLYSKYHAVLIVFFSFLANWKLFTKYQTWLAGVIGLLLFAPHFWWQYQHDWVSFRYHLFESNVNPYKFSHTGDYIIGQLLLPGPIAGFILLPAAFLYKTKNQTERALKFTMTGIYVFFLLSSFRGKVEANWTSPALVPLFILAHNYLAEKIKWQRLLYKLLPVTLLLTLFGRIAMIKDILPVKAVKERYHSWKAWPAEMKERTKGLPVVFSNSYQRASKYWFYSGQPTYSLNHYIAGGRNNYNFWPLEEMMLGKPVYFLDKYQLWRFPDSLKTPIGYVGYKYDSSFVSFGKIKIGSKQRKIRVKADKAVELTITFSIPELYQSFIAAHPLLNDSTRVGVFKSGKWQKDFFTAIRLKDVKDQQPINLFIEEPNLPPGKYYLRFAINAGSYGPTHNSAKIELLVE